MDVVAAQTIFTICQGVLYLWFLFAIGNLIVGPILNAVRKANGKPKKDRSRVIILDVAAIIVYIVVYFVVNTFMYDIS